MEKQELPLPRATWLQVACSMMRCVDLVDLIAFSTSRTLPREQARELFLTFYKDFPGVLDNRNKSGAEEIWRLAKKWEAMIEEEQFSVAALQGKIQVTQHMKTWLTHLLQAISSLIKTIRKVLSTPCLDL